MATFPISVYNVQGLHTINEAGAIKNTRRETGGRFTVYRAGFEPAFVYQDATERLICCCFDQVFRIGFVPQRD